MCGLHAAHRRIIGRPDVPWMEWMTKAKTVMACAGGIPEKARLVTEAPQHWRPPPPFQEGDAGRAPQMGQVAGVAKGHQGTIWVFHRGGRIWGGGTFADSGAGESTLLTQPIKEDVVLQLDQETGV